MNVFSLVVTSGIIPIPVEWMKLSRVRVTISVDGLPEHHDIRRKPATYERILQNIGGRTVNIHWVITRPMLGRPGYLEEYVKFWSARPEVDRIWVSVCTLRKWVSTARRCCRRTIARHSPGNCQAVARKYPKLLFNEGLARAFLLPPKDPNDCVFAKMSANYSADLITRVEPCIFGGTPDCTQCGCAVSIGLHWVKGVKMAGPLKIDHIMEASSKDRAGS